MKLQHRIKKGISLSIGPFSVGIKSSIELVAREIALLYADYPVSFDSRFNDFHIRLARPRNLRRWLRPHRPQALFVFDGQTPFKPLPLAHAFPFFEWGLNWCVSKHANHFLIIHSAVVEKDGRVAIMPSPPGSGKSTLCAALVSKGWRLLSDELALVSPETGLVTPIPRPVSLKNNSINIIRDYAPHLVLGRDAVDTAKGTVAHMKPPIESIQRSTEPGRPAWIIFPEYRAGAVTSLSKRSKARTLIKVTQNAFNHSALGRLGFETAADLVDGCHCYDFVYSSLDEAVDTFNALEPPDPNLDKSDPKSSFDSPVKTTQKSEIIS